MNLNILFITNIPSPYRVSFFNELGKKCNLTVCYERKTSLERNKKWNNDVSCLNYKEIYLDLIPVGADKSKGDAISKFIKKNKNIYNIILLTNYSSPAIKNAILYCILNRIDYCVEYDGGFNKKEPLIKGVVKKFLLSNAKAHFTTCDDHIRYLESLGIAKDRIYKYPFSSQCQSDLAESIRILDKDKAILKKEMNILEEKVILSVGRFSYNRGFGKGYDILLQAATKLENNIGIYIVGDNPTEEFIEMKEKYKLSNLHFVGFKTKEELALYYACADLFVLLTRGDVWGLVINEAMSFGLPVITTDRCMAGKELIENEKNGFIVDVNNLDEIVFKISNLVFDDKKIKNISKNNINKIANYTIENMANCHMLIFEKIVCDYKKYD